MDADMDSVHSVAGRFYFKVSVELADMYDLLIAALKPGEVMPAIEELKGVKDTLGYYLVGDFAHFDLEMALQSAFRLALVAARDKIAFDLVPPLGDTKAHIDDIAWADNINRVRQEKWADAVEFYDAAYGYGGRTNLPSVEIRVSACNSRKPD